MFNNSFYSQVDGVACMGSPLGPTFVFMCYESIWLSECPRQFKLLHYKHFDDIWTHFSNENHINKFSKYINYGHSNIRYRSKREKDSFISFLDVLITKNIGFETSDDRKPTLSRVYLNFDSS